MNEKAKEVREIVKLNRRLAGKEVTISGWPAGTIAEIKRRAIRDDETEPETITGIWGIDFALSYIEGSLRVVNLPTGINIPVSEELRAELEKLAGGEATATATTEAKAEPEKKARGRRSKSK
jgi:hypothetical protein